MTDETQTRPGTGIRPEDEIPLPSSRPGRGRRVALAVAFVLSAVVVGGGTGAGILAARPDREPAVAAPKASGPAYGALADGNHFGSLDDLLLPLPVNYVEGPDDGGLGDDTVLSKDQYERYFDEQFRELKSADRKRLQALLDLAHIRGYALRTYAGLTGDSTVEISLLQENQQHVKASAEWTKEFADATGVYRTGPAVSGFPHARCYLPPGPPGDKLDHMTCTDAEGDLLITMRVDGVAPLDTASAADLFRRQLMRLAIPAAAI